MASVEVIVGGVPGEDMTYDIYTAKLMDLDIAITGYLQYQAFCGTFEEWQGQRLLHIQLLI